MTKQTRSAGKNSYVSCLPFFTVFSVWRQLIPKGAPLSPDINFDDLGRFELGAAGIAAAVLRGATAASQRAQNSCSSMAQSVDPCCALQGAAVVAVITQKDLEAAAQAQVHHISRALCFYICIIGLSHSTSIAAEGDGKRSIQDRAICIHLKCAG
jgi:hypothetical protein